MGLGRLFHGVLLAAIMVPVITWILGKFGAVPPKWMLPATLIGSGAAMYAIDGKAAGEALIGAGAGLAIAPMVMGIGGAPSGTVWG